MYTANPYPGKFEGNRSQLLAQVIYNADMDGADEVCSEEGFGHYALIKGKRYWYILHESEQGFVSVKYGPSSEMSPAWDKVQTAYDLWLIDTGDGEGELDGEALESMDDNK